MNWMKRTSSRFILVIVSIIASTLLGVSTLARQADSVSILMPAPFADATAELVRSFNKEHKGRIHLEIVRGPLETESISDLAISSLLLGDTPFDGLLMDVTWVAKYAKAGWLAPLDAYFTEQDFASLAPGASEGNHAEGALQRWPLTSDLGLLYWRTDLMNEPPRTPQELETISTRLQKNGQVPFGYVWQGRQYEGLSCVFLEMIDGFGGEWYQPQTGAIGLDEPAGTAAATWLQHLIATGISPRAVTNYSESESLQSFKSGESAFMRNWPYAWAELQKDDSPVKGKVGITTMVAESNQRPAATIGSWGLSLLQGSDHPQSTIEAIKYLTNEQSQRYLFTNFGYTPTQAALFKDAQLTSAYPSLVAIGEALPYARPRPQTPLYAQMSDVLQRNLSSTLTGVTPPPAAMNQAQDTTEQVLIAAGATP